MAGTGVPNGTKPAREPSMPAKSAANWKNRTLFHGDNLGFLRAMNSESVDLIATDPPFNKGRDFHATPDSLAKGAKFQDRWSWEKDVHREWIDQITDDHPRLMEAIKGARNAHSDSMGAYMCFMAVRLLEMQRVLKETGSIYLHCDPTASHYLKTIMDAIFGWQNLRNEIVWCYKSGGASPKRHFSKKHDIILWYTKTSKYQYNPQKEKSYNRGFKPYRFAGVKEYEDDIGWYTIVGMKDYWEINMVGRTSQERVGYPTQKPLELYERIINASSNKKDIVLDPFAGCATTLVAAERLNRDWIGIDIWEGAHEVVISRMELTTGLFGNVHYETKLPKRTDDKEIAAPHLRVKQKGKEPTDNYSTNAERKEYLIEQHGIRCRGCNRVFDDSRYLELDHNNPRSAGGWNHVENRILLCSPCNKLKSNTLTLHGLWKENKKRGYMRG